nr:unnamed protein product [Oryza sativa Japonica Group]
MNKLGLHSLRQRTGTFRALATSGEGLYEGLDWLSNNIASKLERFGSWISEPCTSAGLHIIYISPTTHRLPLTKLFVEASTRLFLFVDHMVNVCCSHYSFKIVAELIDYVLSICTRLSEMV